ncbi:uncharacterized protein HD556DRAFT_1308522 [Suillus plorans]|uniref:KOW domain-containing protein n=1 Tax=Suillus plorans TaxID=116603 RepID=A0A9P7DI50_9AGAM|nr:uncharacterized protein HD556DRAFT_1308522 [Suillus plorans]KAG1793683.1 hypothetical protein HD556DRAFT_1308522 [Suillus plorans]
MVDDVFRLCQAVSKEEVEVLKYYLDRHPLSHTMQGWLPMQQLFEPPPDIESIQIGDHIEVLVGQHIGKSGIVRWFPKASNDLWFQDGSLSIPVPIAAVRRIPNLQTLRYTKDRGYDVKPGDVVRVARGPEHPMKGVVFIIKIHNTSLDSFKKDIGQEVFIVGGDHKGYQATLYSFNSKDCILALHGQQRTKMELKDIVTRYGMRLNGIMLEGADMISFCEMRQRSSSASIIDPSMPSSTWTSWTANPEDLNMAANPLSSVNSSKTAEPDPWAVDINDMLDTRTEEPKEGPLAWLMNKEFSPKFTTYHAMLKVSPSFMGGRLHNRFVLTACPDPFLGQNGPAPEGYVAVFCSSNGTGAVIQHYHIPATDLSPAPLCKKNQQCIILDGSHRGSICDIAKCYLKKNTICLVEQSRMIM